MENKKLYLVSCGSGEDYYIAAIFSTEEKARDYLDWCDDTYQLEECECDEPFERYPHIYQIVIDLKSGLLREVKIAHGIDEYKGTVRYMSPGLLYFLIESNSKRWATEEAMRLFDFVKANEKEMFPYLRVFFVRLYGGTTSGSFDYNTGELLLKEDQSVNTYLPDFVKVRRIPQPHFTDYEPGNTKQD